MAAQRANSTFKAIRDYLISEMLQYLNFEGKMVCKEGEAVTLGVCFCSVCGQ